MLRIHTVFDICTNSYIPTVFSRTPLVLRARLTWLSAGTLRLTQAVGLRLVLVVAVGLRTAAAGLGGGPATAASFCECASYYEVHVCVVHF